MSIGIFTFPHLQIFKFSCGRDGSEKPARPEDVGAQGATKRPKGALDCDYDAPGFRVRTCSVQPDGVAGPPKTS